MGKRLREWQGLGWASLLASMVYVASQAKIAQVLGPTAKDLAALQFTWDLEQFKRILGAWTADDEARFFAHFPFDTAHPLIYSTALTLALAYAFRKANVQRWDSLLGVPFLAGLCDLAENAYYQKFFLAWKLDHQDPGLKNLFLLANGFCAAKWAIVAACLLVLAATGIRLRFNRARSRSP